MKALVPTVVIGNNSHMIVNVSKLYLADGDRVADVTYGKGVFWKLIDRSKIHIHESDINHEDPGRRHDFSSLPYPDGDFDVAVFDPPYVHNPGKTSMLNKRYANHATTCGDYHVDIMRIYSRGMEECKRIVRIGGTVWVKCKDEIESSIQCWSHIEVHDFAVGMGMYPRDLFILVPSSMVPRDNRPQRHARKIHSYLWIFERCEAKRMTARIKVTERKPRIK